MNTHHGWAICPWLAWRQVHNQELLRCRVQIFGFPSWSGTMIFNMREMQEPYKTAIRLMGTSPWAPSGGPRGTNLEPSSIPGGLQYHLSVHCSLDLVSPWTLSALASCTVWAWGSPKRCWDTSSVSTWTRRDCQVVPRKQGVKVCGAH